MFVFFILDPPPPPPQSILVIVFHSLFLLLGSYCSRTVLFYNIFSYSLFKKSKPHIVCTMCHLIHLSFATNNVVSCSFDSPRYGSVIVGAILSKLKAKSDPVKKVNDLSVKRRNRRVSFSFLGGMQVILHFYILMYFSLLDILSFAFVVSKANTGCATENCDFILCS
jgi:hypothetical protein